MNGEFIMKTNPKNLEKRFDAGEEILDAFETGIVLNIRRLADLSGILNMSALAREAGIPVQTAQVGTMFGMFFNANPTTNYAEVKMSDTEIYGRYFHALLENGVYMAPSAFEAGFASLVHEGAALDQTLGALESVFKQL